MLPVTASPDFQPHSRRHRTTATADAIRNLRDALKKGGMKNAQVDTLVRNIPGQGYILDLAASEIRLAD